MLRLPIAGLPDGLHVRALRASAEALDLDPAVFGEAEVEVRLDVAGRRILASFEARATATLECDRTLKPYAQPVAGQHAVLFVPPDLYDPGMADDPDVQLLPDDATEVDLTEPVRDTLVLALPMRRVSPEAEAAELRTIYGPDGEADAPGDPRWEALRALRSDPDSAS